MINHIKNQNLAKAVKFVNKITVIKIGIIHEDSKIYQ